MLMNSLAFFSINQVIALFKCYTVLILCNQFNKTTSISIKSTKYFKKSESFINYFYFCCMNAKFCSRYFCLHFGNAYLIGEKIIFDNLRHTNTAQLCFKTCIKGIKKIRNHLPTTAIIDKMTKLRTLLWA